MMELQALSKSSRAGNASRRANHRPEMEVTRTLVKSPPELWAELSDVAALARHLGEFGKIRIVRTEPESVVEWEGDRASGSVRLEPAGWGTRVTLTAEPAPVQRRGRGAGGPGARRRRRAGARPPAAAEPVPAEPSAATGSSASEPVLRAAADAVTDAPRAAPPRRRGFLARLFRRRERVTPQAVAPPPSRAASEAPEPPRPPPVQAVQPPEPPPPAAPAPPPLDEAAVLVQALDALGAAHHRPFSR